MQTFITVVIPTCNRPDMLERCLAALSPGAQTLPADCYEVVVTDDGNSDASERLVRVKFPWVRWAAGPRRGPAANRNSGAALAGSEWLVFTDDDCVPKPEFLWSYRAAIVDFAAVYEGMTTCEGWRNDPLETAPTNEQGGYLWSCNMMVRASFFARIGGFDERFPDACCEDVEFRERLGKLGERFIWVPSAVVDHPPRLRKLFLRAARGEESQIPVLLLQGVRNPYRIVVPRAIKSGLRALWGTPLSLGWVVAAASLLVQSAAVLCMLPSWKRRYGFSFEHPGEGRACDNC